MTPDLLSHFAEIVTGKFPWLARCGLAVSGALQLRSAAGRTEIEGGGPAVGRVGDLVIRLAHDAAGQLYASTDEDAPRTWTPVAAGSTPVTLVPLSADAGTRLAITTGSKAVTCG